MGEASTGGTQVTDPDVSLELRNARALSILEARSLTPPDTDDGVPRPRNPFAPPLQDEEEWR